MGLGSQAVEMIMLYFMTADIILIDFISHEQMRVFKDGATYCVCVLGTSCLVPKEISTAQ